MKEAAWTVKDFEPTVEPRDEEFHLGDVCFLFRPGGSDQKFFAARVGADRSGAPRYMVVEATTEQVQQLFEAEVTIRDFFLRQGQVYMADKTRSGLRVVAVPASQVPASYFPRETPYWTLSKGERLTRESLN